jgi:hypothetical protein
MPLSRPPWSTILKISLIVAIVAGVVTAVLLPIDLWYTNQEKQFRIQDAQLHSFARIKNSVIAIRGENEELRKLLEKSEKARDAIENGLLAVFANSSIEQFLSASEVEGIPSEFEMKATFSVHVELSHSYIDHPKKKKRVGIWKIEHLDVPVQYFRVKRCGLSHGEATPFAKRDESALLQVVSESGHVFLGEIDFREGLQSIDIGTLLRVNWEPIFEKSGSITITAY